MKEHKIKILVDFADDVWTGEKNFEIRENDRGYQKGDLVKFVVVDNRGYEVNHPLNVWKDHIFEITYVLNGWGLKNGFVVFGIREVMTQIKEEEK